MLVLQPTSIFLVSHLAKLIGLTRQPDIMRILASSKTDPLSHWGKRMPQPMDDMDVWVSPKMRHEIPLPRGGRLDEKAAQLGRDVLRSGLGFDCKMGEEGDTFLEAKKEKDIDTDIWCIMMYIYIYIFTHWCLYIDQ